MKTYDLNGSVRIDLLGGTLDLSPINLIIPNVVTVNMAVSLKAHVSLALKDEPGVLRIISQDYQKTYSCEWKQLKAEKSKEKDLSFILEIVDLFANDFNGRSAEITLRSNAPAGSGLGGSSAMGVTLYKCLCQNLGRKFDENDCIKIVRSIEEKILSRGVAGYQDYYPALYGGILALHPSYDGIEVEQFFDKELSLELQNGLTLVYSGVSRNSGINNWQVYKSFFDQENKVDSGLRNIAEISWRGYQFLKKRNVEALLKCIAKEGEIRELLFSDIVPAQVKTLYLKLQKKYPNLGLKMCGAGGGGCFLLVHSPEQKESLKNDIKESSVEILDFSITQPSHLGS